MLFLVRSANPSHPEDTRHVRQSLPAEFDRMTGMDDFSRCSFGMHDGMTLHAFVSPSLTPQESWLLNEALRPQWSEATLKTAVEVAVRSLGKTVRFERSNV